MEGVAVMTLFSDIYRGKSVFLTGITGFKGSWLAFWLEILGAKVTGYSLKPPTEPNHFDLLGLDADIFFEDIRNQEKMNDAIISAKPDIVFHLAAQPLVRYSYSHPKETFETNVIGTLNLFEACRKTDSVRVIINVTTDKCYENKEWIWPYRENDPMGGFDPYSASKGCSELLTSSYRNSYFNTDGFGNEHNVLIASCRAGNVIGGGDWAEDRLVPDIVKAASKGETVNIRSPRAVRPWQHVLDPLSGYLFLGEKLLSGKKDYAEAWNLGPDEDDNKEVLGVLKLMKQSWNRVNYNISADAADLHEANLLRLDSTKAKVKLGWRPVWNTEKAVQMTSEWYKNYYDSKSLCTDKQIEAYIEDAVHMNVKWAKI